MIDRLTIRQRPSGLPVMHQTWGKLLFLHWSVSSELIREFVPEPLKIDTYEGKAWIGITPFTMWNVRLPGLPALPYLSTTHEINVRTYVHFDGVPGVWFFSLDATNSLAVAGARYLYGLPYFTAEISVSDEGDGTIHYSSRRTDKKAAASHFEATWHIGPPLPESDIDSLAFFLVERYCLYSTRRNDVFRARIFHRPWPLGEARLSHLSSTMLEGHGLSVDPAPPVLHQQREPLHVEIWPPRKI